MTSMEELRNIRYLTSDSPRSLFYELLADGALFNPDNNNHGGYSVCRARGPADLAIKETIRQATEPDQSPAPIKDIQ